MPSAPLGHVHAAIHVQRFARDVRSRRRSEECDSVGDIVGGAETAERNLAEQGVAILMISSEMPEVLGMSDRVAVMHAGAIAGVFSREEATQQSVLALALGHSLPEGTGVTQ